MAVDRPQHPRSGSNVHEAFERHIAPTREALSALLDAADQLRDKWGYWPAADSKAMAELAAEAQFAGDPPWGKDPVEFPQIEFGDVVTETPLTFRALRCFPCRVHGDARGSKELAGRVSTPSVLVGQEITRGRRIFTNRSEDIPVQRRRRIDRERGLHEATA